MKRDIQQVLDECVESILNGTATLEECISRLGNDMRTEVEPMLFSVKRVVEDANVTPNEIKKRAGKEVFLAAVEQKRWESGVEREVLLDTSVGKDPYLFLKRMAVAMAGIIALSGTTVAMASESLPGEMLYPVKRAVENAKISITPEGANKRLLYMQAAENRMGELEKLEKNDANYAAVMQDMAESLENAAAGIDQDDAASSEIDLKPEVKKKIRERLAAVEERSEKNIENKMHLFAPGLKPLIEKELVRLERLNNLRSVRNDDANTGGRISPADDKAGTIKKKDNSADSVYDKSRDVRGFAEAGDNTSSSDIGKAQFDRRNLTAEKNRRSEQLIKKNQTKKPPINPIKKNTGGNSGAIENSGSANATSTTTTKRINRNNENLRDKLKPGTSDNVVDRNSPDDARFMREKTPVNQDGSSGNGGN